MTEGDVLDAVAEAFAGAERPDEFIRGTCRCDECLEHDATLAAHTPATIRLGELGNPGWDPICFAGDAAFAYYLPAMLRLALTTDAYTGQLAFHLTCPGRTDALDGPQAAAVLRVVELLTDRALLGEADPYDLPMLEDAAARLRMRIASPA
jgi:hypothetical protein